MKKRGTIFNIRLFVPNGHGLVMSSRLTISALQALRI